MDWPILIVTAFGGGLFVKIVEWLWVWYREPKLAPSFKSDSSCFARARRGHVEHVFVRLGIKNIGRSAAKNVSVYLNEITIVGSQVSVDKKARDFVRLCWAPEEAKVWQIDLPPNIEGFVDVCRMVSGVNVEPQLVCAAKFQPLEVIGLFGRAGDYHCKLVIVSDNAPPRALWVGFSWDGTSKPPIFLRQAALPQDVGRRWS